MQIPVIDLAATAGRALLPQLTAALREVRVLTLTGHGVPAATATAFAAARSFLALPDTTTRRRNIDLQPQGRGFGPAGRQALGQAALPELKDGFCLGAEAWGASVWPEPALVRGFCPGCGADAEALHVVPRRVGAT